MRDKAPEKMGTVAPLFEAVPFEKSMARLARATAGMEAAVMEQKEIFAAFRSTMDEFRDKTEQFDEYMLVNSPDGRAHQRETAARQVPASGPDNGLSHLKRDLRINGARARPPSAMIA